MRKQLTLMAVFIACLFIQAEAQNKISFENVRQVYIRNNGQVMDGEELKG